MDKQLQTLMALYEEEKVALQQLITAHLAEEEYLLAHYHSNALHQLNRRLQTLHNIDDNLYDEKEFKLSSINILEEELREADSEYLKERISQRLLSVKGELERLNHQPSKQGSEKSTSLLNDVLNRLFERKVKNVKLVLKKKDNLYLAFVYSDKLLKVTLPYVRQHVKNNILFNQSLNSFQRLGFQITENGSKLVLTLAGGKNEMLDKLNLILSKVVFEIFYFKEFENESFIEYTDKPSR